MIAKLIEPLSGGNRSREVLIRGEEFLIGRGADCDLRLTDINISRHHCMIRIRPEETTLADLGSANGTYVNSQRVVSQVALKSGDEIRLGECHLIFTLGDAANTESDPDINPLAKTIKLGDVKKGVKDDE